MHDLMVLSTIILAGITAAIWMAKGWRTAAWFAALVILSASTAFTMGLVYREITAPVFSTR